MRVAFDNMATHFSVTVSPAYFNNQLFELHTYGQNSCVCDYSIATNNFRGLRYRLRMSTYLLDCFQTVAARSREFLTKSSCQQTSDCLA